MNRLALSIIMTVEYSCFISYRHNPSGTSEKLIKDLYEALSDEIGVYISDKKIFIDDEPGGGAFLHDKIASALCRSACMIMVFTPTYFELNHLYCAREFKAMEELERVRLQKIGLPKDDHGLIIPIVFRGKDYFPRYIQRKYVDFDGYMPSKGEENLLYSVSKYNGAISRIAKYIYECCMFFEDCWDISLECKNFRLPTDSDVKPWVESLKVPNVPFPNTSGVF